MNAQMLMKTSQEEWSDDEPPALKNAHFLIEWLHKKARQKEHSAAVLARELGVTYGYLRQLTLGMRELENTDAYFSRACARYLEVPAVVVMLVAGQIKVHDFVFTKPAPRMYPLAPAELLDASDDVRALLVNLYREAIDQQLLSPTRLPLLLKELQSAAFVVAEIESIERAKSWAAMYGVEWEE